MFCTNFWIRRVVKFGVEKVKRPTIWNGGSSLYCRDDVRLGPGFIGVHALVSRKEINNLSNFDFSCRVQRPQFSPILVQFWTTWWYSPYFIFALGNRASYFCLRSKLGELIIASCIELRSKLAWLSNFISKDKQFVKQ